MPDLSKLTQVSKKLLSVTPQGPLGKLADVSKKMLKRAQESKVRVMVFQGSARNAENCPDQWGKTRSVIQHAIEAAPDWMEVDYCDLSVRDDGNIIQPCKACVSTAGGFHCHWPCSCYAKDDEDFPDLMHNEDIYARLKKADGFVVYTPINWYAPPSVVKSMFDRLVCANLTITKEQAEQLYGKDDIKNAEKTRAAEKSGKYHHLLKNHLEGKTAAFFIHGDDGAADYKEYVPEGPNEHLEAMPDTLIEHMKHVDGGRPDEGAVNDPKVAIRPIVWQCRYSGIDVPDDLVIGVHVNKGVGYAEGNDQFAKNDEFMALGRGLLVKLGEYIRSRREVGTSASRREVDTSAPSGQSS